MQKSVLKAVEVLKKGGVGIFPTDTVYGIGCRLDDEKAIERVFKIRNRPEEKAVLAVVESVEMAQEYLQPISSEVKEKLMKRYWPGGLTIILPCRKDKVPAFARANGETLGVRQTNHPVLLQILKELNIPLIAPSANFAGEKTPVEFSEIDPKLISLVDFAINEKSGGNKPSTVIDCFATPWKIVREGAVKIEL